MIWGAYVMKEEFEVCDEFIYDIMAVESIIWRAYVLIIRVVIGFYEEVSVSLWWAPRRLVFNIVWGCGS